MAAKKVCRRDGALSASDDRGPGYNLGRTGTDGFKRRAGQYQQHVHGFRRAEIIGLLAQGVAKEAIASGIVNTIAKKLLSLTARVPCNSEITFSGGVANNPAICQICPLGSG